MTQDQALDILKTGASAFVTGPAGSGKTHVVNRYIAYLRQHGVEVGITASTGIAATHMGGVTIHAWSGMGIKDDLSEYELDQLMERANLYKRYERTKVLIVDEVSMLHHFRLDLLDRIAKRMKRNDLPFGGMQVVLVGDFFQLPPVTRRGEPPARFVYQADSWKKAGLEVCYLEEQFRQTDDAALTILNEIRAGEVSEGSRELLRGRYKGKEPMAGGEGGSDGFDAYAEFQEYAEATVSLDELAADDEDEDGEEGTTEAGSIEEALVEPTRIFTHNADVDTINHTALEALSPEAVEYVMVSRGRDVLVEALKKSCLAPEILRLKPGARVMCVKNDFEKGYVNGTLGVVVSCSTYEDPVIRLSDGTEVVMPRATWTIEEEGKIKAEITQYPLRLAWAITVHKSQGMSLDAIEVDLSRSFEPGMGYVALSRVRTLAGLTILGINEAAFQVSPEVLEHDGELRAASQLSVERLQSISKDKLAKAHVAFIERIRPAAKAPKIRTHEETATLIKEGKSLDDVAKARGVTAETIIGHLETLVAEGADIDIAYLKKSISPAKYKKIAEAVTTALDETGEARLGLLKSRLGANASYRDIRLVRLLEGASGKA
jgi:ATP-dependent DNA helicase PIF1